MLIEENKPLAPLTWVKVGGKARYYTEIKKREELIEAFTFIRQQKIPYLYLGQGSNMILPSEGFEGLVIKITNNSLTFDHLEEETVKINVDGGFILGKLIAECRKQNIHGLDNFVGIPGTLGAAIRGNIGIPQEEIGEILESVTCFNGQEFFNLSPEECEFSYRSSAIKKHYWLVWSIQLKVKKGTPQDRDTWLLQRIAKQPKGPSCGSFFKNPDPKNGVFAGKLIEEAGFKGEKLGEAQVSPKHANFLMNTNQAHSQDFIELAKKIRGSVWKNKAVLLEPEVILYNSIGKTIELPHPQDE